MFCYKCGQKLHEEASYCSCCGTPVEKAKETVTDTAIEKNIPSAEKDEIEEDTKQIIEQDKVEGNIKDISSNAKEDKSAVMDEITEGSWYIIKSVLKGLLIVFVIIPLVMSLLYFLYMILGVVIDTSLKSSGHRSLFNIGTLWGIVFAELPWYYTGRLYKNKEHIWKRRSMFIINAFLGSIGGLIGAIVGALLMLGVWRIVNIGKDVSKEK